MLWSSWCQQHNTVKNWTHVMRGQGHRSNSWHIWNRNPCCGQSRKIYIKTSHTIYFFWGCLWLLCFRSMSPSQSRTNQRKLGDSFLLNHINSKKEFFCLFSHKAHTRQCKTWDAFQIHTASSSLAAGAGSQRGKNTFCEFDCDNLLRLAASGAPWWAIHRRGWRGTEGG